VETVDKDRDESASAEIVALDIHKYVTMWKSMLHAKQFSF